MKNKFLCIASVLVLILVTSCKKDNIRKIDKANTIVLPQNGSSIITANNQFAFNFLQQTLQQDIADGNKLISPFSIYLALSMVYNGTDNATKDSISRVLQLSGISIDDLNLVCKALIAQLPAEDKNVHFSIANSIWCNQNNFQPLDFFLNITRNYYDAAVKVENFGNPNTVNDINNWVKEKTNGKIQKILDATSTDDLMYLLDAIYFNGAWTYSFKISDTKNDLFHLQNGNSVEVPFMNQTIKTNLYHDSSFEILELPYGYDNGFSMYIALPGNNQQPMSSFVSFMKADIFANAIKKMDSASVKVEIPRWQYSYNIEDMKPELSSLGMGIAFLANADFSRMYNPDQVRPYITKAVHKTYIKVNEQGTEAAAVTAIGMGTTSYGGPIIFKADHPFLYAIAEKQTGTILFTGVVNDPSVSE